MKKFKINFNYYNDGVIVKTDSMDYAEILEMAAVKLINKKQFHGIYDYNDIIRMLDDEGLDYNTPDEFNIFIEKNNLYYVDLSTHKLRNKKQWQYWINMDYVSINEIKD